MEAQQQSQINLIEEIIQSQNIETKIIEAISEIGLPFQKFLQVYPRSREQVKLLIKLAHLHHFSLYPISRGRNLGYGFNFPCSEEQVVVELSHFNQIGEYDEDLGEVRIETGVTQEQLYLFLQDKPYLMDSTGAGPLASVLGNALDGGIGYSPYGGKRYAIFDLEVVLANGETIYTGHPYAVGPSLTPLFVQGNFGIVLSGKLRLFPQPERLLGLIIQVKAKETLPEVLTRLKSLKINGEVKNIIHFANPMRTFMSSVSLDNPRYASILAKDLITEADLPGNNYYWTGLGGLMGDRDLIAVYRRKISKTLGKLAKITLIDEGKVRLLRRFIAPFSPELEAKLAGLEQFIKLQSGYPITKPWDNIRWRYQSLEATGIIWVGVLLPNKPEVINNFYRELEIIFHQAKLELPVTLSLFEPQSLVGIITILYSRLEKQSQEKAHKIYAQVLAMVTAQGLSLYRQAILPEYRGIPPEKLAFLRQIKAGVDSQGIIAPGKYGI